MPITVPAGVTVNVAEGNVVTVKGPKGELTKALRPEMILKQEGSTITVERPSDDKLHRSLHGLTRTLLHNMIVGVTDGYKKELEVNGVGYRVGQGDTIILESCEYCNSFLSFFPTVAVILNVEEDHLDFFKDLADIQHSFRRFAELVPPAGSVIVNARHSTIIMNIVWTLLSFKQGTPKRI